MYLTQKDYFNTDINITWFAQAECLPCCGWNWGLQSVFCSPNASSVACFCQRQILTANPCCDCNVSYNYGGTRGEEYFCAILGIQIEICSVRIILLVNRFFSIRFYGLNIGNY